MAPDAARAPPSLPKAPQRRSRPPPAAGSPGFRFPAPHPYNATASPTSSDGLLPGLAYRASYPAASSQEALLEKPIVEHDLVERPGPREKLLDAPSPSPTPPRPARPPASLFSNSSSRRTRPDVDSTSAKTRARSPPLGTARATRRGPGSLALAAVGSSSSSAQASHQVIELHGVGDDTIDKKERLEQEQALQVVAVDAPQRSTTRSRASVSVASSTRRRKTAKRRIVVVVIALVVAPAIAAGVAVVVRRSRAAQDEERAGTATSAAAGATMPPSTSSTPSARDVVWTQVDSPFADGLATQGPSGASATTSSSTADDGLPAASTSSRSRITTRVRPSTASRTAAPSTAHSTPTARSTSRPRASSSSSSAGASLSRRDHAAG